MHVGFRDTVAGSHEVSEASFSLASSLASGGEQTTARENISQVGYTRGRVVPFKKHRVRFATRRWPFRRRLGGARGKRQRQRTGNISAI
jgi:hypothetical protein